MGKFLAIDTSSKYLTVIVYSDKPYVTYIADCAMRHSVCLMQAIEDTFAKASITAADCDFFAVCIGAGSFTGIRIGISCIKGLAYAFNKPILPVTAFQVAAYTEEGALLTLIDALHGNFYACGFDGYKSEDISPRYISADEALSLSAGRKTVSVDDISVPHISVNAAEGLLAAVLALEKNKSAFIKCCAEGEAALSALYIRKSQAEENLESGALKK